MSVDTPIGVLTIAALYTAAGAGAAALIIRQVIELLKAAIPLLDAKLSGAFQAFVLSCALYFFAAIAAPLDGPDGVLLWVTSWLTCATASVGIDAAWTRARSQ